MGSQNVTDMQLQTQKNNRMWQRWLRVAQLSAAAAPESYLYTLLQWPRIYCKEKRTWIRWIEKKTTGIEAFFLQIWSVVKRNTFKSSIVFDEFRASNSVRMCQKWIEIYITVVSINTSPVPPYDALRSTEAGI